MRPDLDARAKLNGVDSVNFAKSELSECYCKVNATVKFSQYYDDCVHHSA